MVCPLLVQKQDFFVLHNLFFIALHFLGPKTGNKTFGVLSLPISSTLQGQEERNYCKYTTLSSLKGGTKMWNKCNLRRTANLLCFWNFCLITSLPEYICLNGMVHCVFYLWSHATLPTQHAMLPLSVRNLSCFFTSIRDGFYQSLYRSRHKRAIKEERRIGLIKPELHWTAITHFHILEEIW